MSISDLSKFRESKDPASRVWRMEPLRPALGLVLLAVDQSLGKAGWAVIERDGSIRETGMCKTTSDLTGHAQTLDQGAQQFQMFRDLLEDFPDVARVAHEIPPISRPGLKMQRPESSLVSAAMLRAACIVHGVDVVMVGSQKAKKRFTGNGNAEKALVREAIHRLDPRLDAIKPMNEDIRDAIALGWVACEEER